MRNFIKIAGSAIIMAAIVAPAASAWTLSTNNYSETQRKEKYVLTCADGTAYYDNNIYSTDYNNKKCANHGGIMNPRGDVGIGSAVTARVSQARQADRHVFVREDEDGNGCTGPRCGPKQKTVLSTGPRSIR